MDRFPYRLKEQISLMRKHSVNIPSPSDKTHIPFSALGYCLSAIEGVFPEDGPGLALLLSVSLSYIFYRLGQTKQFENMLNNPMQITIHGLKIIIQKATFSVKEGLPFL